MTIKLIVILRIINSYIIIKENDNDKDDKNNVQNKDNEKYQILLQKCKWLIKM